MCAALPHMTLHVKILRLLQTMAVVHAQKYGYMVCGSVVRLKLCGEEQTRLAATPTVGRKIEKLKVIISIHGFSGERMEWSVFGEISSHF